MINYKEEDGITTKTEYTNFDMVGWSCMDAGSLFRATVTVFSISEGVISVTNKIVNADGSDYKPTYYRNVYNGFSLA